MESGGKKRTSILTRILLACLLPVAVVFAILLFLTAKALYEEASDSAKNTAALFSDHVTEMVKTNFLNATGSLAFVAKNLGVIAKSGSQTLAESGELLRMFLESNPSLYCAWFAFEPGVLGEKRFTRDFVRRDEAIVEIFDLTDELLTDETRSPWYSGALKSGEPYFDSVGFYDYGEGPAPVFTVSFPIKIDDRVVGVVGMDALYGSFYRGLGALKIPGSREIALLSVDARVLYSTHKEDDGETGGRPPLKSAYDREKLDAVLANGKYYAGEGVSPISGAPSYMSIYPVEIENARQPIFLHVERPASVVFGRARGLVRTLLAAGAVLAVLLGCCVYLATRRVTGALKLLTDKADAVAEGDYDIHFDPGKRDGKEIARLQTSLAEMADCLKRNGQERRVFVEALTSKVAQRNRTIYEVNLIASNLDVRAEQIIDATRTLHRATESNAAEIDGIAASSVDIKDSSMEHAESAESGLAMADAAYRDTEHVAREAKNVSDLIGSVHESGNRAGEIVRTINDLSFQTALLAINATIEAARAGSKGNSFTIVADEVKRLANRSARAAEATGDVIKTMTARIDDAYEKIDNLCAAISDARDNIRQLREITGSVAKVASEQTSAVSAIITSLEKSSRNMDAVVSVSKSTAGIACSIQEYSSALRQTTNDDLDDIVTA